MYFYCKNIPQFLNFFRIMCPINPIAINKYFND